jgi:hypothetical protein
MSTATDHGALRPETPATYYEGLVRVPGFEDAPERCRDMKPVGFCEHGHVLLGRSSCGTRYCPDHWRDWCEDAVINMVARLAAYREARDGWEKRMVHAAASPPPERRYSRRGLWETRSEAYEAMKAAGARGGAVVTHPYRTTEEANRLFESADTPEGMGKWRFIRELVGDLDGDEWQNIQQYVEPSPHYHGLVAAEDLDGSRAPEGWVVENIRSFDPFQYDDPESYQDMVATAYYVLTHGGVQDGRSTTTYFGEVHPNAFDPAEELTVSKWRRIQHEAERAVKGVEEIGEETDGVGTAGPAECPRDDCEAVVRELEQLPAYLNDEEFLSHIRTLKEGRARLARLRGTVAYWEERTDRPPPSARRSKARYLEWLQERGEVFRPEPNQTRLSAVMG